MGGESTAMAVSAGHSPTETSTEPDVQTVLEALSDPDCRAVLRAAGPSALTASECSEACDLPLSTAYRKLELLSAAGLIEEQLRLRRDGKHASQYRRRFGGVRVEVTDDGDFDVTVSPRADGEPGED